MYARIKQSRLRSRPLWLRCLQGPSRRLLIELRFAINNEICSSAFPRFLGFIESLFFTLAFVKFSVRVQFKYCQTYLRLLSELSPKIDMRDLLSITADQMSETEIFRHSPVIVFPC